MTVEGTALNISMPKTPADKSSSRAKASSTGDKAVAATRTSKTAAKSQQNSPRSAQLSINVFDQTLLKVLATIGGTSVSPMIRDILSPYLDFAKKILQEEDCINDVGLFSMTPEEIIERFEGEVSRDPEKYLRRMLEHGKEHGLDFELWVKPDRLM